MDRTYREWIERDGTEVDKRRGVFYAIRNIPYIVDTDLLDPVNGPEKMLERGHGSCTPKHFLMGILFGKLGLDVRYPTFLFNWNEQGFEWTKELSKIADELPAWSHLALEVDLKGNGNYTLVDATWDPALNKAGFHVNEWDGTSPTINAVKEVGKVVHYTPEKRIDYLKEAGSFSHRRGDEFFEKFNAWLKGLRM